MQQTTSPSRSRRGGRAVLAAVGVSLMLLASVACGSGATETPSAQRQDDVTVQAAGDEVVMRLIAYRPETLSVSRGTTVTWRQQDAGFHTVTSGTVSESEGDVETKPDATFGSGRLEKGKTFVFTFDDAGTYPYFCEIHPATMQAKVTVE